MPPAVVGPHLTDRPQLARVAHLADATALQRRGQAAAAPLRELGDDVVSGKPLFDLATRRLAQLRQRVGTLPIVGVGGIHSPESAVAKFEAGADVIQLYSALVFGGLDLLRARDLVFRYVPSRWLMGDKSPAFDVLAWNSDAVRMPRRRNSGTGGHQP